MGLLPASSSGWSELQVVIAGDDRAIVSPMEGGLSSRNQGPFELFRLAGLMVLRHSGDSPGHATVIGFYRASCAGGVAFALAVGRASWRPTAACVPVLDWVVMPRPTPTSGGLAASAFRPTQWVDGLGTQGFMDGLTPLPCSPPGYPGPTWLISLSAECPHEQPVAPFGAPLG